MNIQEQTSCFQCKTSAYSRTYAEIRRLKENCYVQIYICDFDVSEYISMVAIAYKVLE